MPRSILGWESKNLVIPIRISISLRRNPDYIDVAALRVQPFIQASLAEALREGWQADEPTDFATLFSRSQVRTKNTLTRWRIESVTVRLIRAIDDERVVPHG
jgi:hypothetical protein